MLSREEFVNGLQEQIGANNTPETIDFIDSMITTYDELSNNQRNDDYVPRSELDRVNTEWAQKFRDRFYNPTPEPRLEPQPEPEPEPVNISINDLFT